MQTIVRVILVATAPIFMLTFYIYTQIQPRFTVSADIGNVAVGVGTALLALVTYISSMKNIKQNRLDRMSEYRRVWIEQLREKIALFCSSANMLHLNYSASVQGKKVGFRPEAGDLMEKLSNLKIEIELMLNQDEELHAHLIQKLDDALSIDKELNNKELIEAARTVTKAEWNRVKSALR